VEKKNSPAFGLFDISTGEDPELKIIDQGSEDD
jgi:hypothetical protein